MWFISNCCYPAGCEEPIPPSGVFIDGFQSAAEGSTVAYSCSPGLVPTPQMSVCTNMTWRPDPATLQCREPLSRESGNFTIVFSICHMHPASPADYIVIPYTWTLLCTNLLHAVDMAYPTQTTSLRPTPTPSSTPTPNSTSNRPGENVGLLHVFYKDWCTWEHFYVEFNLPWPQKWRIKLGNACNTENDKIVVIVHTIILFAH